MEPEVRLIVRTDEYWVKILVPVMDGWFVRVLSLWTVNPAVNGKVGTAGRGVLSVEVDGTGSQ